MAGDDRVGEVDDRLQHVGPFGRVALERQRGDAEEAQVAREAHVGVGDEHDDVALGVAARRQNLRARGQRRGAVDQMRRGSGPELGEVVELLLERAHERLVRVDRHVLVEHRARLRRREHARVREGLRAADVVDVAVGEDDPAHRQVERLHCVGEGLPLRADHHRVDDRQAVVVHDHARVAHAGLAAGLEPDVHAVRELVQRAGRSGLRHAPSV